MTDTHENLIKKDLELHNFYNMANEAIEANDVNQALEFSNNGLEQAKLEDNGEWVEKFNSLQNKLENKSLSPGVIKEDITMIKGIGTTAAGHLNKEGITSIEQLATMTVDRLSQVRGIGPTTAEKIIQGAKSHITTKGLDNFTQDGPLPKFQEKVEELDYTEFVGEAELEYQEEEDSEDETEEFQYSEGPEVVDKLLNDKTELQQKPWFDPKYKINRRELHQSPRIKRAPPVIKDFESSVAEEEEDFEYVRPEGLDDMNFQKVELKYEEDPEDNLAVENQIDSRTSFTPEKVEQVIREPPIEAENRRIFSHSELQEFSKKISEKLKENKFFLIAKKPQLRDIYHGIDILAVKLIEINDTLQTICIIPIKISVIDDSLLVSSAKISQKANSQNPIPAIERKLEAYGVTLTNAYETIFENMVSRGNFYLYLNKYLGLGVTEGKIKTRKNLYFRSGPLQYKVIITPVLISQNDVKFTEKIIPFAYQKDSNLYIVSITDFSNLTQYLGQKYSLIESYNKKQSSLSLNKEIKSTTVRQVRISSIPFMLVGILFLLISILQGFSGVAWITNLGIGAFGLYGIILGYFYFSHHKRKVKLRHEFSTPSHKKKIELDETSLILIREELQPKLMEQFVYECLDNTNSSKIIADVEKSNAQEFLTQKTIQKKVSRASLFESKDKDKSELNDQMGRKYGTFLED